MASSATETLSGRSYLPHSCVLACRGRIRTSLSLLLWLYWRDCLTCGLVLTHEQLISTRFSKPDRGTDATDRNCLHIISNAASGFSAIYSFRRIFDAREIHVLYIEKLLAIDVGVGLITQVIVTIRVIDKV